MQNLEYNKENKNPDHFPNTTVTTTTTTIYTPKAIADNSEVNSETQDISPPSTSAATKPKFSFASDYRPSKHFSAISAPTYDYSSSLPISSFAVLNNDYSSSFANKPNAIVHPIRRLEQTALPKNPQNVLGRELRITGYNPGLSVTHPPLGGSDVRNFAEELNRKLSFLDSSHGSRDFKNSSHHGSNQETLHQRPLFITTVPRGIFLPPPKDIVLLSPTRKRQLYAYASHPVVYNTTSSTLSSSYNQHTNTNNNNNNTHQSHKIIKGTSHQNYHNRNSLTMAKDKYQTTNSQRGEGDGGIAIASNDKDLMGTTTTTPATGAAVTKASSHINAVRGSTYATTATVTAPVLGGFHISKQQFQQQLQQNRKRETPPPPEPYKNVMYDRRIIRGSNFGGNPLLSEYDPFDKTAEYRRRQALRKKNVTHKNQRNVLGTPPPVEGRRHEDVQTDRYLEELVARPPEFSVETQTDLFLEKPPTPPYIPAKIGVDVATEIGDGELFQFEAEAQPLIDVLIDSIMEMSILEVAHEQEISGIRKKQQELLAHREAELAELRRLESEELRLQAEKERRLRQDSIAKTLDDEMQRDVTAAKLLQGHIASILPEVLDSLEPATDAAKKEELMKTVCPWLSAEVAEEVGQIVDSREILTVIIQEIIKQRAEIYAGYKEEVPTSSKLELIDEEEHDVEEICKAETKPHEPPSPPEV